MAVIEGEPGWGVGIFASELLASSASFPNELIILLKWASEAVNASSLNVSPINPERWLLNVSRIDDALLAYPQKQKYRPGIDMSSPSPKLFVS